MKTNIFLEYRHLKVMFLISFLTFGWFTKWRYGLVIDATDEFVIGFPLGYKCRGFHTSLSTQYFVLELLANFLVHTALVSTMILLIDRWFFRIHIPKILSYFLWGIVLVYNVLFIYASNGLDDRWKWRRDFDFIEIDAGYKLFYQNNPDRAIYQEQLRDLDQ